MTDPVRSRATERTPGRRDSKASSDAISVPQKQVRNATSATLMRHTTPSADTD
jgi:hypothetical protein